MTNPINPDFMYAPPAPPKRHRLRNWLLGIGAAIVLLIVLVTALGGGGDNGTQPQGGTTTTSAPQGTTAAKPTPPPTTKPTPPPPVAKHWTKLITLTGTADKNSDTITTKGGQLRLSYTMTGSDGIAAIYLLDEGTDFQAEGGIPIVMITDPGKDTTLLRKNAGDYYLMVSAANFRYTVTLEELR